MPLLELDGLVVDIATPRGVLHAVRDVSFRMLRILGRFLFGFSFDRAEHGGPPLHRALVTLSTGSVARHSSCCPTRPSTSSV